MQGLFGYPNVSWNFRGVDYGDLEGYCPRFECFATVSTTAKNSNSAGNCSGELYFSFPRSIPVAGFPLRDACLFIFDMPLFR
jgi:hypothetical protein